MRDIAPWFGLTQVTDADKTVVVLGCPFGASATFRAGAGEGPRAIRAWTRTAEAITEVGHPVAGLRVIDCGDVTADGDDGESRWRATEIRAGEVLAEYPGAFLLGLGGDHAVTPPLAAAARRAHGDLAFLLLDAHPDCFAVYDGDPLSHACVVPRLWDRAGFARRSTAIVGVRSYAFDELEIMDTAGLVVPARPWQAFDPGALAAEIRESTRGMPLYISVDIDVLDPSCAPGTGYPVAGGPGVRGLLALLAEIFERQPVVAMDLVEVAPALDPSGITAANAAHLLLQVLGYLSVAI
ncbi:MAG: arginase family protein [Acidobacteriota bacterium]|jgi:agmatinase